MSDTWICYGTLLLMIVPFMLVGIQTWRREGQRQARIRAQGGEPYEEGGVGAGQPATRRAPRGARPPGGENPPHYLFEEGGTLYVAPQGSEDYALIEGYMGRKRGETGSRGRHTSAR